MNILETKEVSKSYSSHKVLDKVSISIKEGEIFGLLGPNGAGKTTLIKILTGLIRDYQGTVLVKDKPLGIESRKVISYLP